MNSKYHHAINNFIYCDTDTLTKSCPQLYIYNELLLNLLLGNVNTSLLILQNNNWLKIKVSYIHMQQLKYLHKKITSNWSISMPVTMYIWVTLQLLQALNFIGRDRVTALFFKGQDPLFLFFVVLLNQLRPCKSCEVTRISKILGKKPIFNWEA